MSAMLSLGKLQKGAVKLAPLTFVRGKRTEKLAPGAVRLLNLVSLISARGKLPNTLKLCREDIVRHNTIRHAYSLHLASEQNERRIKLEKQYDSIKAACSKLEELDADLFKASLEPTQRFPIELRVPTDTPPRVVWNTGFTKDT